MELKFEELPYQLDAVNAVANLFAGQPNHARTFDLTSQGTGRFVGNGLDLDWETLGRNLNAVQKQNGQPETEIGAQNLCLSAYGLRIKPPLRLEEVCDCRAECADTRRRVEKFGNYEGAF